MLVVTRRRSQDTIITVPPSTKPTVIRHTTVEIRGDKVRQGYTADKAVRINRSEVQERIDRENKH